MSPLPPVENAAPPLVAAPVKATGPKIKVASFRITGNNSIPTDELQPLVAPSEGKALTLSELEQTAARITLYYRSRGYFMARAYLPEQEIRHDIVTIAVLEGEYGKLSLDNKSLVDDDVIADILARIKAGDVITAESLEQTLGLINELPGAVVSATDALKGQKVGSSDFIVNTAPTPRVVGSISANNYGSIYTGENILLANADINSPFGLGDRISTQGMITTNTNLQNYRLAYSLPLTTGGLRGEVSFSKTNYQLAGPFTSLDALGESHSLELMLSYPFARARGKTLDGSFTLGHRYLQDEIRSTSTKTPKQANFATAALTSSADDNWLGFLGRTTLTGSMTLGNLEINEDVASAQDALGAKTQGDYGKVNFAFNRVTYLDQSWRLMTSLRMQHTLFNKNLDGSEDMALSGISGVKAYPPGEFSAENAYLFNAEAQYVLPVENPFSARLGFFYDKGYASMQNPIGTDTSRALSDIGIALYGNYENYFMTLHVAKRTDAAATSEPAHRIRTFLQVGRTF